MKRAIFPGTFDPITNGHVGIVEMGLSLFDEIIIAIGSNVKKTQLFSIEQRKTWIEDIFKNNNRVKVMAYEGLTVAFCRLQKANFIIRGLRNSTDFEYEQSIAHANKKMVSDIETVFLLAPTSAATISSSIVREIIISGGDYSLFVPKEVNIKKS
ncbi:MAG: pantetheine-phosphate adenylyltransferase [Bacteroidetes bacterium]|nr:pantetheine-phosphate adenylyltransferase [Bacteroidota bacterium]